MKIKYNRLKRNILKEEYDKIVVTVNGVPMNLNILYVNDGWNNISIPTNITDLTTNYVTRSKEGIISDMFIFKKGQYFKTNLQEINNLEEEYLSVYLEIENVSRIYYHFD